MTNTLQKIAFGEPHSDKIIMETRQQRKELNFSLHEFMLQDYARASSEHLKLLTELTFEPGTDGIRRIA